MQYLNELFTWLLRASWQGSVLIGLILVVQWLFRGKLSAGWLYSLWLLVVIRLLLPVAPPSAVSIFNLTHFDPASSSALTLQRLDDSSPTLVGDPPTARESQTTSPAPRPKTTTELKPGGASPSPALTVHTSPSPLRPFRDWFPFIWLAGVALVLARLAWQNVRFALRIRDLRPLTDSAVLELLEDCKKAIGLRTPFTILESSAVTTPALYGFVRPKLLLPAGVMGALTPEELRHVFLHELAHVKRFDMPVNWLVSALLVLHWFNPVIWFGLRRMSADRELAADALALSRAQPVDSHAYGQTILKLLENLVRPAAMPGVIGILEEKQQMTERITMIAQFKKSSGWPVAALALVTLLGCVSLTDGKREKTTPTTGLNKSHRNARLRDSVGDADGLLIKKTEADNLGRWVASPDSCPSPDGRYLAYVNWAFGNFAVCDTKTGELRDLTSDGTWDGPDQFAWRSVWSPDSKQIAFVWYKGDAIELRIVDCIGGRPRVLVPFEQGGGIWPQDWSKDGRFIVGLAPMKKWPKDAKKIFQIVRVEVPSGAVKVVKELPDATDSVNLSLSPDGRHIVYDFPAGQLRSVSTDGSNDSRLIDHPAKHRSPRWMPDGRHLVFLSDRSGADALWVVPVENGKAAGEPRMVRDGFQNTRLLGFTDEGALYYLASTPRINVFVADVEFDKATMQTPRLVSLRNDGRNRNPRWSADGSELAYVSRTNSGTQIATLVFWNTTTGNERVLENSVMNNFGEWPRWSPDLSKLIGKAYSSGDDKGSGAFYLVDVKRGERSKFWNKNGDSPNLSADGSSLIYRRHLWEGPKAVGCELIERDLKNDKERVIAKREDAGFNSPMLLSKDDRRLAYCEGQSMVLVTARADGASKTVWQPARGTASILDWLPDNRRLLVAVEDEQQRQQLHLVDTETNSAGLLGAPFRRNNHVQHLSVHPDGKRIAFSRGDVVTEIWTMKNIVPSDQVAAK